MKIPKDNREYRATRRSSTFVSGLAILAIFAGMTLMLTAKQFSQLTANFIQLTLSVNFTWTGNDPFHESSPSFISPSPLPCGVFTNVTDSGVVYMAIPYEYHITVAPVNNHANTNYIQIYELANNTGQITATDGSVTTSPFTKTGTYNNINSQPDPTVAFEGSLANPEFFALDAPGPQKSSYEGLANNTSVLSAALTIVLHGNPMYYNSATSGYYTDGTPPSTQSSTTYSYTCSYYTNTAGTIPTTSTANYWSGTPHWFGSHS